MHVLCAPSTDSPNSLPIFNDKQTILISNNTVVSTYDFTVQQKHEDAGNLQMGNYIVFKDKYKKTRMYTLISFDGDDLTRTWHAEDIGLDLIAETANKWDYTGESHPIEWYLSNFVLDDSGWTIGINEVADLTRGLKFEGQSDSKLKRLGDIANQFDRAEIDFTIEMNGSTVTKQVVNIYKKVGTDLTQERFIDSVNLKSLQSSGSIADLCTAMLGLGSSLQNEDGSDGGQITFINELYDDGRYYSPVGQPYIFDRVARQQWSRFRGYGYQDQGEFQGYIDGIYTYDTSNPKELLNRTLSELKKRNTPSETYEANLLDISADVGDYVQIAHNNYNPPIYLSARVEQVENCYTASGQDTGVLGDYTRLQSQIDPRVQDMIDALKNQIKANYTWIRYAKDDKGTGMTATPTTDTKYVTIVSNKPTGIPSDDPADYAGHWQLIKGSDGKDGIPGATGADGKTSYTHFAYADNVSGTKDFSTDDPTGRSYMGVYSDFTKTDSNNPSDYVWSYTKGETGPEGMQGAQGPKGDVGIPGKPGADGKTPYTHVAYADDDKGGRFSQSPDNKAYMGWYTDFTQADSTDTTKYAWSLIKGADGKDGADGVAGKDGVGVTATVITYAQSTSGTTPPTASWTANVPTLIKGQYLWTRTVWTYTDSTTETGYTVSYNAKDGNNGSDGVAGKDGVGIKSTTITYATSTSGTSAPTNGWVSTPPSATAGQFIWTRTIWTYTDDTTETGYSVGKIGEKGATGSTGENGAPGRPGADGRTPYFHQAWADSKDGKINFSTTDPTNRGYLGTYTDFTQADSTDPTKYFWVELVGALSIGGRNYLADTNTSWQVQGSGGTNQSSSMKWLFTFGTIKQAPFNDGDYVTVSFDYISVGTGAYGTVMTQFNGTPWAQFNGGEPMKDNGHFVRTIPWKSDWTTNGTAVGIQIRLDNVATTRTVTVYNMQFERGNKATDHKVAPEDTQKQIDATNQGLADTNSKIAAVTKVDSQATAPTNPKKGDQWWVKDANGNINAFKIWDGTKWADSIIQQSAMNISTLNGNIINGATINGSEFTNNFDYTGPDKNHFQGVTQIKDGAVNITWKIPENNQTGNTTLNASGLESIIRDPKGTMISSARLQMGELYLSDGHVSGSLNEQDAYRNSTQSIQYLGGWGDWDGSNGSGLITVTRNGRMVTLSGYPKQNGSPNFSNIVQLPEWAKPTRDVNLPAMSLNSSVLNPIAAKLAVNTNGTLSATFTQQGGYVAIGASYFGKDIS